jgi:hypothetical protein
VPDHLPQNRHLPQPSGIQIPEQARHSRHALLGEVEGLRRMAAIIHSLACFILLTINYSPVTAGSH